MIEYGPKDIMSLDVDCIINTVNCQVDLLYARKQRQPSRFPTAQQGLAKEFELKLPASQPPLISACAKGLMKPGMVLVVEIDRKSGQKVGKGEGDLVVAHVATKDHWQNPSRIEWVETAVEKLAKFAQERELKSIAIPPLGAGLGKLPWAEVQKRIHKAFEPLAAQGMKVFVLREDVLGLQDVSTKTSGSSAERQMTYAGIGPRPKTLPPAVYPKLKEIGQLMAAEGFVLRSGGAEGADDAFEKGALERGGKMEIFLPQPTFNGRRHDGITYICEPNQKADEIAKKFYNRNWDQQGTFTKAAMARNTQQALGRHLNDNTNIIITYTEDGKIVGGTGQALRLAEGYGIPVINLGVAPWSKMKPSEIVSDAARIAKREETLEAAILRRSKAARKGMER